LSDKQGFVSAQPEDLLRAIKSRATTKEIEGAVRILERSKALTLSNGDQTRVHVRLLATPERIKRELTGEANAELGLLRALWRGVGPALRTGAVVDLDGLPPGLGGSASCAPLLDALEEKQFLTWERLGTGLYLADKSAPLSRFRVDWAIIDRRRSAELSKLQAVQKYAYTRECRRGFVLRYFGDPAARPKCSGCDNCLGSTAVATVEDDEPRKHRGRKKAVRSSSALADVSDDVVMGVAEERLLATLKTVRTAIAREEQVPAYIVFSDRTLAELAVRRPRSLNALQNVRGVGPMKLERYGARFLAAISKADETEAA
jgi:ATP-dependent DNA helicase RecQ